MDNKNITEESKRRREKQIAIIKASNELLESTKESLMKNPHLSEEEKKSLSQRINYAKEENITKGRTYLQADRKEIEDAVYQGATEEYKERYQKYMEKRGISEEQLSRKEMATAEYTTKEGKTRTKRKRLREEEIQDDEIVRLPNEDELMKMSMAKDDNDLEKRRRENNSSIQEMRINAEQQKKGDGLKINPSSLKPSDVSVSTNDNSNEKNKQNNVKTIESNDSDKTNQTEKVKYDFDFSSIPSHVQYDVIPLPSNGECYPHKKGRIPVAYLTAADENIIASPNMYRDGKIIDIILKRKILDKGIDVDSLCKGDRDAITLWLRATGYGTDFPIVVTNPDNGHRYELTANLANFKYIPFNLKGDENGNFAYYCHNDVIMFKYLTMAEEEMLRDNIMKQNANASVIDILKYSSILRSIIQNDNTMDSSLKEDLFGCVDDIDKITNEVEITVDEQQIYSFSITEQMIMHTVSVNGNRDREFIRNYIENMRAGDARAFRNYVADNRPGVDFGMKVNIPESDGGGSFDTFLRIDDTIFINV